MFYNGEVSTFHNYKIISISGSFDKCKHVYATNNGVPKYMKQKLT